METMFTYASAFNGDISKWDVSKVTHMVEMFTNAKSFNSDVSKWDVSKVTDMTRILPPRHHLTVTSLTGTCPDSAMAGQPKYSACSSARHHLHRLSAARGSP